MTIGLRVRRVDGRVDLDSTVRASRLLDVFMVTQVPGSRRVNGLRSGTPFYHYCRVRVGQLNSLTPVLHVTFSGDIVSWQFDPAMFEPHHYYLPLRLAIGVY